MWSFLLLSGTNIMEKSVHAIADKCRELQWLDLR